jgi:xanthine dehydrogenase molybdenum-binding subunit
MSAPFRAIGRRVARLGLAERTTGEQRFAADLKLPGMLYGKLLRSPHPRARIVRIDASRALALPGVRAVLTPCDVPPLPLTEDCLVLDREVRFVGDEVAAVAADEEAIAEDALGLIAVDYQVLPAVLDPGAALAPGAPAIHPRGNLAGGAPVVVARGDVAAGFGTAVRSFEATYETPVHSAAGMEPRAVLAAWDGSALTVWKTSRAVHMRDRPTLAKALDLSLDRVRVICPAMGGGFGNKDEGRLAALAALLARRAGRPVRIEYTREEEFVAGRTRHPSRTHLRAGVDATGQVCAIEAKTLMTCGAYLTSGLNVIRRVGHGPTVLYRSPHARFEGTLVYTNRPVGGSYRALGAPQGHFALECLMDEVAEALGEDPLAFRLARHVPREGQPGPRETPADSLVDSQTAEGGVPFSSHGLAACLERGAAAIGWRERWEPPAAKSGPRRRGLGVAMAIYRGGPGGESQAEIRLGADGRAHVHVGIVDVGEGAATVLAQIAAETLGLPLERVGVVLADTGETPYAPMTSGSTVTFSSGLAVRQAAAQLRERVLSAAAARLGRPAETLAFEDGAVRAADGSARIALADFLPAPGRPWLAGARVMPGSREAIVCSFAAHFVEVEVDVETGRLAIPRYVAAHDSGRILSPLQALNQVEGAVGQMLGFALTEELVLDRATGVTLNPNYLEHKCPTLIDVPRIEVLFVETDDPVGPFGAKALGEPPSVPVAPALANAIYNAIGVRLRRLPMTPDRILAAWRARGAEKNDHR